MKKLNYLWLLSTACVMMACGSNSQSKETENEATEVIEKSQIINNKVITKQKQEKLTPDQVVEILKAGNKDFTTDNLTVRNTSERVRAAETGQFPKAVIVSCLDSRVPVEDVFHLGIGDVFVARVAGNTVNPEILGSLEFACKVSGAKVIMVLGHESCGAVVNAIDDVKLGNITAMLARIRPAVAQTEKTFKGESKSSNSQFVQAVADENVSLTIKEIRGKSKILKEMEDAGKIKIIGGMYKLNSGEVDFL